MISRSKPQRTGSKYSPARRHTRPNAVGRLKLVWAATLLAIAMPVVGGGTAVADSYADPAQLDCPWPQHSFYKQPWRGFLEVRSGEAFLRGLGVNYHSPGNDEVAIRLLAETGVRAYRYEIGWSSIPWDESQVGGRQKHLKALRLMRQYDGRPTLLLNAHHGVPCPIRFFERTLAVDASKGATSIRLTDTKELVPGRSGINGLDDYWAAQVLITSVDPATGQCRLSKALPWDLKADKPVRMATLKYAPLCPVDTPAFEETAAGWVKYALMVCDLAAEAGHKEFDVEIWNELSFGSNFVNIDHYYEKGKSPYAGQRADFLNPGGSSWELSRRTIEIFPGDDRHPPLTHQDVFAFLPFQTNARRLVIPVYVITYDVTERMPEETYQLTIKGLDAEAKSVHLIDPITGQREQLPATGAAASVRVEVNVADYPRLLVVEW